MQEPTKPKPEKPKRGLAGADYELEVLKRQSEKLTNTLPHHDKRKEK